MLVEENIYFMFKLFHLPDNNLLGHKTDNKQKWMQIFSFWVLLTLTGKEYSFYDELVSERAFSDCIKMNNKNTGI